jgi:hypothetical protein
MSSLHPCPHCSRHYRACEGICPFCGGELPACEAAPASRAAAARMTVVRAAVPGGPATQTAAATREEAHPLSIVPSPPSHL